MMAVIMETDSFFYKLLKRLPQTFFAMIGLPLTLARHYRFDSVEVKKSLRIDGLFLPDEASQPLYFVEVQFQKLATFYANLFTKVFAYLEENDPAQEWVAVAIFSSRSMEPDGIGPYEVLLQSRHVRRIYLDEYPMPANPPLGLSLLQLVTAPADQTKPLVKQLVRKAEDENADRAEGAKVLELVEELMMRKFEKLTREEVLKMFDLTPLRKTRAWQETYEEGQVKGMTLLKKDLVRKWMAKGMATKDIAALLEITVREVRRLAKEDAAE